MLIDRTKTFPSHAEKKINDANFEATNVKKNQQTEIKTVSELKKKPSNPYNYKLIENLETEHGALLETYKLLMRSANERDYESISGFLNEFCMSLTEHLKHEDNELYLFLDFNYSEAKFHQEQSVLKDFRSEMKNITVELESIIHQSPNIPVSDKTVEGFILEFNELGKILVDRIHREETDLYPLYTSLDPQIES